MIKMNPDQEIRILKEKIEKLESIYLDLDNLKEHVHNLTIPKDVQEAN